METVTGLDIEFTGFRIERHKYLLVPSLQDFVDVEQNYHGSVFQGTRKFTELLKSLPLVLHDSSE